MAQDEEVPDIESLKDQMREYMRYFSNKYNTYEQDAVCHLTLTP